MSEILSVEQIMNKHIVGRDLEIDDKKWLTRGPISIVMPQHRLIFLRIRCKFMKPIGGANGAWMVYPNDEEFREVCGEMALEEDGSITGMIMRLKGNSAPSGKREKDPFRIYPRKQRLQNKDIRHTPVV